MAIVLRSVKGSNLTPDEADGNFSDLDGRVTTLEVTPVDPITITSIALVGTAFTMGLSDGSTIGPITFTVPMPQWRGAWTALTAYTQLNFFKGPSGELGAVLRDHTSAASFDWAATDDDDNPLYLNISGSADGALNGLSDVDLTGLLTGHSLVYDGTEWVPGYRVSGPASAVNDNLPAYDGTTGKLLKDSGVAVGDVVLGPATVADDRIATYDGTTGKLLQDSGVTVADLTKEFLLVDVSRDETTTLTTGASKYVFRMPYAATLLEVRSSVSTVSSSGLVTVDINESGSSILSTKLTIDATEKTSTTAATAAVISDAALADDAEITIDIDAAGTGAKGLKITLIGTRA